MTTYSGTRGPSSTHTNTTEPSTGKNGRTIASTSWLYAAMNLEVCDTSVPPKRLEWNVIDWLESASKLMVAKS